MELQFFTPWDDVQMTANRLPHWEQAGGTYFVTFHLADSLPNSLLDQWREEREAWLRWNPEPWSAVQERQYNELFSASVERWLDAGHGECRLRDFEVRATVADIIGKFDRDRYWHHAWVLMPNHVHLLFSMREGGSLCDLLKVWKGASARAVGALTGVRTPQSPFWQKDYFDRLIRDRAHFLNCARYIRRNPEKANLRPRDYSLYLSEEVQGILE